MYALLLWSDLVGVQPAKMHVSAVAALGEPLLERVLPFTLATASMVPVINVEADSSDVYGTESCNSSRLLF